jgi:hypothetical protein
VYYYEVNCQNKWLHVVHNNFAMHHLLHYTYIIHHPLWCTLNNVYSVTNPILSCSTNKHIVTRPCSITNTKCKPYINCHSLNKHSGIDDWQCSQILSLTRSNYSSNFQSCMIIYYYKYVRMHNIPNFVSIIGMDIIQSSIIHDITCKLNHKNCH